MTILTTKELVLRPLQRSDLDDYCVHKSARGRGIATAAVRAVTRHAMRKYGLRRIEGWCRTWNKASARVLEKAGYRLEGILRKHKCKDGKYLDDMVWAYVR